MPRKPMPPRKHPIERGPWKKGKAMKRKPPAYPSKKQLRERAAWAAQFDHCFLCGHRVIHNPTGFTTCAAHVHHIAGRGVAPGRFECLSNLAVCCHLCHLEVVHTNGGNWWAALLAAKQLSDPKHYDLEKWRALVDYSGRDAVVITQDKIDGAREALELRRFQYAVIK